MNYHTGERAHQCSICGKTFHQMSALTKHTARHATTRNFACHLCAKCFVVKKDLNVHIKLVHEKPREARGIPTRDSLDISFEFQEWPGKTEHNTDLSCNSNITTAVKTEPEPDRKVEKNTEALLDKDWLEDEDKKRFLDQWMDSPAKTTSPSNHSDATLVIPNIPKLSDPNNSS